MREAADPQLPTGLAERILERTAEAVLICDHRRRILWVNAAFTRMTGYTLEQVQGESMIIFRNSHHDTAFYEGIYEVLMHTGTWSGEIWRRRRDGAIFPANVTVNRIDGATPEDTYYVEFVTDLAALKRHERRVEFLAGHDALTELPNRVLFQDRLEGALARAERHGTRVAILFADMDNLKEINDTHGHPVGDRVLQEAAARLQASVRDEDTVARISGDEFVLLLERLTDPTAADRVCQSVQRTFETPLTHDGLRVSMAISIGISHYPDDGTDPDALVARADASMYRAKRAGGGQADPDAHDS